MYQEGWEAKNLDQLSNRIKSKIKQINQSMVTNMIQEVRGNLLKMYRQGVYFVC